MKKSPGSNNGANGSKGTPKNASRVGPFMTLPVDQLLAEFGAGRAVPGAGSALALAGALSGSLVKTVAQLTLTHHYPHFHARAALIKEEAGRITESLIAAADEDAQIFRQVIDARCNRDMATNPKERERLGQIALHHQMAATDLPLRVAFDCLKLSEFALELYDKGFKSARGDSSGAADGAVSSAQSALFLVALNLKPYTNEVWVRVRRAACARALVRTELIAAKVRKRLRTALAPEVCEKVVLPASGKKRFRKIPPLSHTSRPVFR